MGHSTVPSFFFWVRYPPISEPLTWCCYHLSRIFNFSRNQLLAKQVSVYKLKKKKSSDGLSRFFFLTHSPIFLPLSRSSLRLAFSGKGFFLKDHNRFDIVKGKYQNDKTLFWLLLFCFPFFFISFLWVLCMGWVGKSPQIFFWFVWMAWEFV